MTRFRKALVAGAVGLAVLVPAGMAVADGPTPWSGGGCSQEQRQEHMAQRDQLTTQITDQLAQEGVTDPAEVQLQLRIRLHEAMQQQMDGMGGMDEMGGPHHGAGMASS